VQLVKLNVIVGTLSKNVAQEKIIGVHLIIIFWKVKIMIKYDIYAGLGGKFLNTNLGPNFQMTREFPSDAEARKFAREIAINRYQYHEGKNDIFSWNQCKNDIM
jgi:hypothetical protein